MFQSPFPIPRGNEQGMDDPGAQDVSGPGSAELLGHPSRAQDSDMGREMMKADVRRTETSSPVNGFLCPGIPALCISLLESILLHVCVCVTSQLQLWK